GTGTATCSPPAPAASTFSPRTARTWAASRRARRPPTATGATTAAPSTWRLITTSAVSRPLRRAWAGSFPDLPPPCGQPNNHPMAPGEWLTAAGYGVGAAVFLTEARRRGWRTDRLVWVALWGLVGGVFGARLAEWGQHGDLLR